MNAYFCNISSEQWIASLNSTIATYEIAYEPAYEILVLSQGRAAKS